MHIEEPFNAYLRGLSPCQNTLHMNIKKIEANYRSAQHVDVYRSIVHPISQGMTSRLLQYVTLCQMKQCIYKACYEGAGMVIHRASRVIPLWRRTSAQIYTLKSLKIIHILYNVLSSVPTFSNELCIVIPLRATPS